MNGEVATPRYADLMEKAGIVPFQREPWVNPRTGRVESGVLGARLPWRWRVSRDEWERLERQTSQAYGWLIPLKGAVEMAGFPIEPDDSLPPKTVVFEPILPSLSAVPGTETEPENAKSAAPAVGRDVR